MIDGIASDVTLLPCPFCGGKASKRLFYGGKYGVYCDECSARVGGLFDTEAEAIAAWNSRAELGSEPPYDELLRCLENDWHIRASWDGLRKFWCIELTEEGVKLRDATHGTLTAEQVRESIERRFGKVAVLDDGKPVEWRDDWVCKVGIDYKGITDELNATLGGGECVMEYGGDVAESTARVMGVYFCSECGSPNYNDCMPYHCIYCGKSVRR